MTKFDYATKSLRLECALMLLANSMLLISEKEVFPKDFDLEELYSCKLAKLWRKWGKKLVIFAKFSKWRPLW